MRKIVGILFLLLAFLTTASSDVYLFFNTTNLLKSLNLIQVSTYSDHENIGQPTPLGPISNYYLSSNSILHDSQLYVYVNVTKVAGMGGGPGMPGPNQFSINVSVLINSNTQLTLNLYPYYLNVSTGNGPHNTPLINYAELVFISSGITQSAPVFSSTPQPSLINSTVTLESGLTTLNLTFSLSLNHHLIHGPKTYPIYLNFSVLVVASPQIASPQNQYGVRYYYIWNFYVQISGQNIQTSTESFPGYPPTLNTIPLFQ